MFLSCVVHTLWDLCDCQVIIEATVHLDKNGCKLEQKHLLKDVGLLIELKKERKQGRC